MRFVRAALEDKLRCLDHFGIDERERDLRQPHWRALRGSIKDAVRHSLGAQRLMALLAQDPGDGVHNVGFAATVGANDAGQPAAAECDLSLLTERFEAHQLDFAQFQQDFPFMASAVVRWVALQLYKLRQRLVPIPGKETNCDKITEGSFSSGPAAWRYDGGYGNTS